MAACRLTINIVVHNRLDMTRACIESLFANTTEPFTLQIVDNASTDGTREYLQQLARRYRRYKQNTIHVLYKQENLGFPVRQNELASSVTTPYICVLNNDVEVGNGWQIPLIAALESNPRLAQVGPSAPSIPEYLGGNQTGRAEYIEGWCFIMPTEVARKVGLFSPDYYFAYFEDTDLSLRLQEAGYAIAAIPAPVMHKHSATRQICTEDVLGYELCNRLVFQRRWKHYLHLRHFRYRCKIIRPGANGDLLMLTPAIRSLRDKWPRAFIAVETDCVEILLHNPNIDLLIPSGRDWMKEWDIVWDLTDATEERLNVPPVQVYCDLLGVENRHRPELTIEPWDRSKVQAWIPKDSYAVLHIGPTWATKTWPYVRFKSLGILLQERLGLRIVEVGTAETPRLWLDHDLRGRLRWQELGVVMEQASVFIGIDSGPAHIAQIMGTPAVVLFGSTRPDLLLHAHARVRALQAEWLQCLGCYSLHPEGSHVAECVRGDIRCMSDITVERAFTAVQEILQHA